MESKRSKIWQEVETNRMWREIDHCDEKGEISPRAWSHLKKIAKNMCNTDFSHKSKYKNILRALSYDSDYELRQLLQVENEIKFIIGCIYCAIEKGDGDTEKFFKDENREYIDDMIELYDNIKKYTKDDKKIENIHSNVKRQFYRLLRKFNIKNKISKKDGKIDLFDIIKNYENMMSDHLEYGEDKSFYVGILKFTADAPQRNKRLQQWYFDKLRQEREK